MYCCSYLTIVYISELFCYRESTVYQNRTEVITQSEARQCYVCGIGADEPFKNTKFIETENGENLSKEREGEILTTCNEFDHSTSLEKYIYECPENFVGCITQFDGDEVTRTCDRLPLDDCQTANGIKYCYCDLDLCNNKYKTKLTTIDNHHHKTIHSTNTDDEDLIEASGMKETTISETSTNNIILTTTFPEKISVLSKGNQNLQINTIQIIFISLSTMIQLFFYLK